jgi:hypothetical protein
MGLAPLSHPLDMGGATEVILVGRFLEPATLTGGFARLAAGGLRTIVLPPHIAEVRIKKGLTVLALAFSAVTSHGPASPQAYDRHGAAWKEENQEENAGEKKRKKSEGMKEMACAGRKWTEAILHSHPARLIAVSGRR